MTEEPELPDSEALAAEHALGVLNAHDRAMAEAKMAADPAFAAAVEAWRARLVPLAGEVASVEPRPELWARISSALPANDDGRLSRAVRFWRASTAGALALAAASLAAVAVLATRPPVVVTQPGPPPGALLNANLMGETGKPLFVAAYDPVRKALIITSLVPPGADPAHVHELWLIPSDGQPRSLGFVEPGTSKAMPMEPGMAPMVSPGAALAVSVEAPGGSTGPGPTGPVAAKGMLSKI
jgi:anti-sigma-K factor RskA